MIMNKLIIISTGLVMTLATGSLLAADPSELGKSLTPLGAERAGNAAGTIPAWTGGLTTVMPGHKKYAHYLDPFADDKPLFTITPASLDKYKDNLSPGQIALFKKYSDYKMHIYQTRRTASAPKAVYDETIANATRARLAAGGNGVLGTSAGVPFPIPKSGVEPIWNHVLRYRADAYEQVLTQAAVTRGGDYTLVRFEYELDFSYGNLSKKPSERTPNLIVYFLQTITSPARLAGQVLLVHEYVDQVSEPRKAWTYNPGQRRVRLAPNVAYDNPSSAADGLATNDDFNMYNGATDRYNWKLVGKKEMYIPYNAYKISSNKVKYKDIIKPGHINQDLARYELHRVWVVEATLKPGTSHIYKRRTFYIDEDSWNITVADKYDNRNELWRVAETHPINYYDIPVHFGTVSTQMDLQSGRYLVGGLNNEEPYVYRDIKRSPSDFTPASLRARGTR